MTCDAIRELLPDVLTGSHAGEEGPRVDAHLAGCAACRAEADLLRALLDRLRDAVGPDPDQAVAPPPLEAVLAAARARSAPAVRRAPRLLQAAALLLAAGLGALADRAFVSPPAPIRPISSLVVATRPELNPSVREVVAAQPGGLAASLALLGALSEPHSTKR